MTSYTQIADVDGNPLVGMVRRDDGAHVLTGRHAGPNGVADDPDFGDADGLAYRAWLAAGNVPGVPPTDLKAYAAAVRYAKETGGITVGNAPVATDRESQANITALWLAAQLHPGLTAQFKSDGSGYAELVAGQIQAVASAVTAHVQACRAVEAQIDAGITAGTVTTTADIDQAFAAVPA